MIQKKLFLFAAALCFACGCFAQEFKDKQLSLDKNNSSKENKLITVPKTENSPSMGEPTGTYMMRRPTEPISNGPVNPVIESKSNELKQRDNSAIELKSKPRK